MSPVWICCVPTTVRWSWKSIPRRAWKGSKQLRARILPTCRSGSSRSDSPSSATSAASPARAAKAKAEAMRAAFEIAGHRIKPGRRALVGLEMPRLSSHTALTMPVHVIHGRRDGPTLFVCAAIHGDELNGVEIIRQVLKTRALNQLRGTLIAVPVVNAYGLIQESRYLPDRRDLNRSFPGSVQGSLAARLANLFLEEIVSRCTHGIDLHTGAIHRSNLPQI